VELHETIGLAEQGGIPRRFRPPLLGAGKLAGTAATSSLFLRTIAGENSILRRKEFL
jgi:hypothetical protein